MAIIKTFSVKALNKEYRFKVAENEGTVEVYSRFVPENPKSQCAPLAQLRMHKIKRRAEISALEKKVTEAAASMTTQQLTEEGDLYYYGWCERSKNRATAEIYYRLAVEIAGGSPSGGDAMAKLGSLYLEGAPGIPKDHLRGATLLRKAADLGNESGMYRLGLLCENGSDYVQALHWYRRLADSGEPLGMMKVGKMYLQGRGGLRENFQEGIKWLLRAAREEPLGMVELGDAYRDYHDIGEVEDITEAVRWYLRAAFKGVLLGAERLAELYVKGIWDLDIPKADILDTVNLASVTLRSIFDKNAIEELREEFITLNPLIQIRKLIERFHKAADHNYLWATRALAMVYDRGHEIRRDADRAAYLLMLAIDRGDKTVLSDIDNKRYLFSDECVRKLQGQLEARIKE